MADLFANKIKRLELENFTCFGKVAMDFSPGINVFIGENGTGKTHLLKVLYGLIGLISESMLDKRDLDKPNMQFSPTPIILTLRDFFKTSVKTLARDSRNKDVKIIIGYSGKKANYSFNTTTQISNDWEILHSLHQGNRNGKHNNLFIPVTEMMSWFEGFIPAYEKRESSIDETYYGLAKALDPFPLKGKALELQIPLMQALEDVIQAKVIRRGNQFFLAFFDEQQEHSAPIVATGINKLAQLIYLIMNGSLTKDTILFWDEPEANLHPKYIVIVAKFLKTLANAGCQIFVATHDYLLLNELSLMAEFKDVEPDAPDMKFFSLLKGENGTEVQEGKVIAEIKNNPILDEYARHHETQLGLYAQRLQTN